jgi:hypothetical protein
MSFIQPLPIFLKKTPSLRLRLRVARPRARSILSGLCPVSVQSFSGPCPAIVRCEIIADPHIQSREL